MALVIVLVLLWLFMAGQYGQYQAMVAPGTMACLQALQANGTAPAWGPSTLVRWLSPRQSQRCYGGAAGKFDARYLIDWGARWAPLMRSRRGWGVGSSARDVGAVASCCRSGAVVLSRLRPLPPPLPSASPQRWLTSCLLHQNFVHLLSNSLMLAGFGWQVECKHGTWRIAALAVLAALAGGLLRWVWGSRRHGCRVVLLCSSQQQPCIPPPPNPTAAP